MEERVLEAMGENFWVWSSELEKYFSGCDMQTHYVVIIPGFIEAVESLRNQGIIRVIHRLVIKGKYKTYGKTIEKRDQKSEIRSQE
jgi:hypothetical protein